MKKSEINDIAEISGCICKKFQLIMIKIEIMTAYKPRFWMWRINGFHLSNRILIKCKRKSNKAYSETVSAKTIFDNAFSEIQPNALFRAISLSLYRDFKCLSWLFPLPSARRLPEWFRSLPELLRAQPLVLPAPVQRLSHRTGKYKSENDPSRYAAGV